jgi:hypothetical protein
MTNEAPTLKPLFIHARGIQLEHMAPIHFVKSSMSPAHLQRKQSWWNTAYYAHDSKMLLSRRWTYFLRRRTHRRRMDVRLRPCQQDTNPSHRTPLDRYVATPPTIWTRETDEETGAIYRNETMTETTSFIISLDSFRVQSLQEHEIRVIARYGTTAGELTRHISTHYGANPRDFYLTVDGTPLENWDKVNSDYDQHILLRTRLRGGVRRSSRELEKLDVTKEMCTIRKGESSDHSMGQQDEDRQVQVRAGLSRLRNRMWSQHHPLLPVMDRFLSEKKGTISQDDLKNLHHLSTDCSTRTSLQRGLF